MKDKTKEILKAKRRGVDVSTDGEAGGFIDTDFFRYAVTTEQSNRNPSNMRIVRSLVLRKPLKEFPGEFDDIFVAKLDEVVIPVEFDGADYDDIADALETFAEENDGQFSEVASDGLIMLSFRDRRLQMSFRSDKKTLRFSGMGISGADTWPAPGSAGHIRSLCPLPGREGQRDQLCLIGGSYAGSQDGSGDHTRSRCTREIERSYRSNKKRFRQAFLRQVGGSVSYREPSGYSPEHPVPDTSAPRPTGSLLPPGLAGRDSPLQYSGSGYLHVHETRGPLCFRCRGAECFL
jgi:hypothetical protein